MTAVLIIPLAFSNAGQGTWLAYAFGTVMLLFVVFCLNQFARRSASAGSMYTYTARGLGPATGVLSGWTLIWCYLFIGIAGLSGFAVFAAQFLSAVHLAVPPPVVLFAISAVIPWSSDRGALAPPRGRPVPGRARPAAVYARPCPLPANAGRLVEL